MKTVTIFGIAISLILIAGSLAYFGVFTQDEISSGLPSDAKIVKVYRSGGFGNGDYIYAMKAKIERNAFLKYVQTLGLSNAVEDPTSVIGFNASQDDVPSSMKAVWDEPAIPDLKYYAMRNRSFVRVTYSCGYLYYYSRGW